jgi:hypothetical protein
MKRRAIETVKEFRDVMGAIGACLEGRERAVLAGMAWRLVPFNMRRSGVLDPARTYRFRGMAMPTAKQCKVPPRSAKRRTK